jgi:hypothetical protein
MHQPHQPIVPQYCSTSAWWCGGVGYVVELSYYPAGSGLSGRGSGLGGGARWRHPIPVPWLRNIQYYETAMLQCIGPDQKQLVRVCAVQPACFLEPTRLSVEVTSAVSRLYICSVLYSNTILTLCLRGLPKHAFMDGRHHKKLATNTLSSSPCIVFTPNRSLSRWLEKSQP